MMYKVVVIQSHTHNDYMVDDEVAFYYDRMTDALHIVSHLEKHSLADIKFEISRIEVGCAITKNKEEK